MALWLIPLTTFALFSSIFLGGTSVEPKGGNGLRQSLGLLASAVVHIVLWNGLRILFATFTGPVAAMIFASLLMIPGVALSTFIGFILFGVKLGQVSAAH
jgi:hypothetical protein